MCQPSSRVEKAHAVVDKGPHMTVNYEFCILDTQARSIAEWWQISSAQTIGNPPAGKTLKSIGSIMQRCQVNTFTAAR